jgi:ABC-type branched-subunit amino acid transport system ATPase component
MQLKNIYKSFGNVNVLSGVNLCLEQGLVYTLIGGNGSGKTTLINIISGFLAPTSGTIEFKGKEVAKFAPYRVNRLGIGRTFQDLRLAMRLTVYENILLAMEKRMFARPTNEQLAQKPAQTFGEVRKGIEGVYHQMEAVLNATPDGTKELELGKDYNLSYKNNTDVGNLK